MNRVCASNKSDLVIPVFCVEVIMKNIANTNIRYFDLVLLVPSLVFCVFLVVHCRNMAKSQAISHNSSIINTFYVLLCAACCLKVVRASVVMFLNSSEPAIQIADKVMWLIVRFFLLATEMSILTFGVAAARLDSRTGIRRVLIVTSIISFSYTAVQASLEFASPDERFHANSLYGHGGALFVFISSVLFLLVYCSILLLPLCCGCGRRLRLPTKRMFYGYCAILALLYSVESVGSILFFLGIKVGLCLIDFTTVVYFTCYDPLVYATFLHNYMRNRRVLAFKYNEGLIRHPDTSDEFYKTQSNGSNQQQINYSASHQFQKGEEFLSDFDTQYCERSSAFSPDNLVTLQGDDVMNIYQIMKDYNILSEGAQMEFESRCPSSSVVGCEISSVDDKEKSIILSLSEETESPRRTTFGLTDFAIN